MLIIPIKSIQMSAKARSSKKKMKRYDDA